MKRLSFFKGGDSNSSGGFTLVELLVVIAITSYLTLNLMSNFLRSDVNLNEMAKIVLADVRQAQANALASKQFNNTYRCGYGLNWLSNSSYQLYTGQDSASSSCSQRHFNDSASTPVVLTRVLDSRLEILNPQNNGECGDAGMGPNCPKFEDIYFESPLNKIYLNQQNQPNNQNNNRSQILIRKIGATCPSKQCVYVCVYSHGRIETRSSMCPRGSN